MNVIDYNQRPSFDLNSDLAKSPKRAPQSTGFDKVHATPSAPVAVTPPRVVSPSQSVESPEYCHKPTATSTGSNYVSPLKPQEPNMRYSLNNGSLEKTTSVAPEKENIPRSVNESEKMPSKVSSSEIYPTSRSSRKSSSKSKTLKSRRKHDPNSYKIFLLLLQPKMKTFELIQLIYSPTDTTIGGIIAMIPDNATEPALGTQKYTGLCRPKTEEEITDHELLASESRTNTGVNSAKITLGEILVAIPEGYTGPVLSALAKQILSNPKIVKLLKRSDPLAPKRRRSSRRSSRRSTRRSRSKEHVDIMEKFDEHDEIKQEQEKKDRKAQEKKMKEAMEHAAQVAAASNAEIPGTSSTGILKTSKRAVPRSQSIVSLDDSLTEGSMTDRSMESSLQESIDESYSSWSKSFDASFASTVCSGVSKRSVRRRERQNRRSKIIQTSAIAGFIVMLAMYFMDPHGYGASEEEKQEMQAATTENPMGLTGIIQCLFLLLSLYQIELFVRSTSNPNGQTQSSFIEYIQSTKAVKKLKARFYKKLKKTSRSRRAAVGAFDYDYDDNSALTQKLRSFSLKGNNSFRSHNFDDTGSL